MIGEKCFVQEFESDRISKFEVERIPADLASGDNGLTKGIGITHDQGRLLSAAESVEHLCPKQYIGIVCLLYFIGPTVARWKEEYIFLPQKRLHIVQEIGRFFLVSFDNECRAFKLFENGGAEHGIHRAAQSIYADLTAARPFGGLHKSLHIGSGRKALEDL